MDGEQAEEPERSSEYLGGLSGGCWAWVPVAGALVQTSHSCCGWTHPGNESTASRRFASCYTFPPELHTLSPNIQYTRSHVHIEWQGRIELNWTLEFEDVMVFLLCLFNTLSVLSTRNTTSSYSSSSRNRKAESPAGRGPPLLFPWVQ